MQEKLYAALCVEFPGANIKREQNFIDLSVETANELLLFEIKSDLDPRVVIRHALGQLLQYAFYTTPRLALPVRLVIVGRRPLTPADTRYFQHLREAFSLLLEYRAVPLPTLL
ncbi:MAG TPA: hypothetical protein VKY92_21290 [Verrucomicrobiae bacterium]|jgi:Holliday junction resolvase|nr:hypothetical protein [Verrucomicrobiae bacterium]